RRKSRPDAADGRETGEVDTPAAARETGEIDARAAAQAEQDAAEAAPEEPVQPSQPVVIPRPPAVPRPIAAPARATPVPPAPAAVLPEAAAAKAEARRISIPPAPRLAPATIPPGMAPIVDTQKDEPEAVSLQEIETLLSPGKAPPGRDAS